jgi:hypothetical protein
MELKDRMVRTYDGLGLSADERRSLEDLTRKEKSPAQQRIDDTEATDPSIIAVHPSVTLHRVIAGVEANNGIGFCAKCGNEQSGCAPLDRNLTCSVCRCDSVFGADEAFMVFRFTDDWGELWGPVPSGP